VPAFRTTKQQAPFKQGLSSSQFVTRQWIFPNDDFI